MDAQKDPGMGARRNSETKTQVRDTPSPGYKRSEGRESEYELPGRGGRGVKRRKKTPGTSESATGDNGRLEAM